MYDKIKQSLRDNKTAEAVSYGLIVAGLILALGPYITITIAGVVLLNEFVDG